MYIFTLFATKIKASTQKAKKAFSQNPQTQVRIFISLCVCMLGNANIYPTQTYISLAQAYIYLIPHIYP